MIDFGNISGIWLIVPISLVIVLTVLRSGFQIKILKILSKSGLSINNDKVFLIKKFKVLLLIVALLSLLVSFLGPKWGESSQVAPQKVRDIVVALDVSKSMLAQDFKPNRLLFAKNKIKDLINGLHGDRLGLIIFSGDALVMCPLTRDKDILISFLDDAQVETISGGTTNTARAIEVAAKMMGEVGGSATKLLAIFTDGEDFSEGLEGAGKKAKDVGMKIFTVGVATIKGAPIPDIDRNGNNNGFIKNDQDTVVISKLNRSLLKDISVKCGGSYVEALDDDSDIEKIVSFIEQFEKKHMQDKDISIKEEKYYYFAVISFICLLVEWLL